MTVLIHCPRSTLQGIAMSITIRIIVVIVEVDGKGSLSWICCRLLRRSIHNYYFPVALKKGTISNHYSSLEHYYIICSIV